MPIILVVEDDIPLRAALVAALTAQGYQPKEAGDVSGALEHFSAGPIDVVLSDVGMPGNGYNLLAKVKEMRPETPVILMTGIEEDDLGRRAREAGADAYLIKPIRMSVLKGQPGLCGRVQVAVACVATKEVERQRRLQTSFACFRRCLPIATIRLRVELGLCGALA